MAEDAPDNPLTVGDIGEAIRGGAAGATVGAGTRVPASEVQDVYTEGILAGRPGPSLTGWGRHGQMPRRVAASHAGNCGEGDEELGDESTVKDVVIKTR